MASLDLALESGPTSPFVFDVPQPPTFPTASELRAKLDHVWKTIQATSLDPVFHSPEEDPFGDEELVKGLFVNEGRVIVREICLFWKCQDQPDFDINEFFMTKLKDYLTIQCQALRPTIEKVRSGGLLLKTTYRKTKRLWIIISYLQDFFLYLDVQFTEQEGRFPRVKQMAVKVYHAEVYDKLSARLRKFAMQTLEFFRMGDQKLLMTLLQYRALIDSISYQSEEFMEKEWNKPLRLNCLQRLREKEDYHKRKCLCYYIKSASKRDFEVSTFSAGKKNLFTFRTEIFQKSEEFFFADDGKPIKHLLEEDCYKALRGACRTYGTDQEFMKKVANILERHLSDTIIGNFKEYVGENPEPSFFFAEFLQLWTKMKVIARDGLTNGLGNEQYLYHAFHAPFHSLFNDNEQVIIEQLQLCFDKILWIDGGKATLKGRFLQDEIESAVLLIGSLSNSEEFLDTYKNKLTKRLPYETFSRKNTKMFLKPLTANFSYWDGAAKLNGMMSMITRQKENSICFTPMKSPEPKRRVRYAMGFLGTKAVKILEWPEGYNVPMKLPEQMREKTDEYNKFFEGAHKKKTFEYNFSLDRIIISTKLFTKGRRRIQVYMSTYQACILELFQRKNCLSVARVLEKLKSESEQEGDQGDETAFQEVLFKCLRSMMTKEYPILIKTPDSPAFDMMDMLSLNTGFIAAGRKVVLPTV